MLDKSSTPCVSATSRGRIVFFPTPFPHITEGGRLAHFLNISGNWSLQTSGFFQYCMGGGLELQFQSRPPLSSIPLNMSVTRDPDRNLLLQEEVHTLLQKDAVVLMNHLLTPGFYSRLFLVPKKNGEMRPVIDLSVLNQHLMVPHFKMETNRSIRGSIHLGMWTTSVDLTDAYFHIPISPKLCKFLRFVWEDRVYAFKTMPFGLSTAPLVFIRIF